jgi:addiction module RelB/DinJ family antitoxin
MSNTNITIRIDESLKKDLQILMSNLGMDITTFFTLAAKQAVREQALPFQPKMSDGRYDSKAYQLAMKNTAYDSDGRAVITKDDEWRDETEWDDIYEQMKAERGL